MHVEWLLVILSFRDRSEEGGGERRKEWCVLVISVCAGVRAGRWNPDQPSSPGGAQVL